jgi:hypothetical protein
MVAKTQHFRSLAWERSKLNLATGHRPVQNNAPYSLLMAFADGSMSALAHAFNRAGTVPDIGPSKIINQGRS